MRNLVYLFVLVGANGHSPLPLYGAEAKDLQISEDSLRVRITIFTDALQYNDFVLHNPERIVINFKETSCHLPSNKPVNIPPVISIRAGQYMRTPSPVTRVVIDLASRALFPKESRFHRNGAGYSVTKIPDGIYIDIPKTVIASPESLRDEAISSSPDSSIIKENIATPVMPERGAGSTSGTRLIADSLGQKAKTELPEVRKKAEVTKVKEEKVKKSSKNTVLSLPVSSTQHPVSRFVYDSRGKRDPFKPWLGAEGIESDSLLNVYNATIVGIMWSPRERYALAEDSLGKGFILSEGDKVVNGRVEIINKDEVSFALYGFGGVRRVTLKLLTKEERGKETNKKEKAKRQMGGSLR